MGLKKMSCSAEVSIVFVGLMEVECPECGARTRVRDPDIRGFEVQCSNCPVMLLVSEDADYESDESLAIAPGE